MGLSKNEHGVYHVRKKVPAKLQEAVARVLALPRPRITWLKRSLHTKDLREANIRAKPILIRFDHVLAKAEALTADVPLRDTLSDNEIERIASYHYATMLAEDEETRREGTGSQALFLDVARQLKGAGVPVKTPFPLEEKPPFGLTDREMTKLEEIVEWTLPAAEQALARGDVTFSIEAVDDLLNLFRINLDRRSSAYRQLAMAVLQQDVRALRAVAQRNRGEPIETPRVFDPKIAGSQHSGGLLQALEGWKKGREPAPNTLREFVYGISRFIEIHGDLPVIEITRRHVREFREALQEMPKRRAGKLRQAPLPELVKWAQAHPEAARIERGTINKLLGACQTVALWARDNGVLPDDAPWSDPFANMRLEEVEPDREPWEANELRTLFSSPVFVAGERPSGGRGEAAYWLPLLGLFTGARLGELAGLMVPDVQTDEETDITILNITDDENQGKRLKTASSRRVIPVHPELVRLGFLQLAEERRRLDGEAAMLFPLLTLSARGSRGDAWSKWFGRYIRGLGISSGSRVFHSFRHNFKDALRAAGVGEDVNDFLTGHAGGGVGRAYGRKDRARRFGLRVLADAVSKVSYPGLDLSQL